MHEQRSKCKNKKLEEKFGFQTPRLGVTIASKMLPICMYMQDVLQPKSVFFTVCIDLPQVSLEWVLIGYIQFIMRSKLIS
jgi:hypothetical protein